MAGYYPGGKTGTTEKVGKHGYHRGVRNDFNVSAFVCVFPMNNPQYAVYMMLDEPHGNKSTYGFSTAGWVSAPAAGRVIARIGPMLGLLPDIKDAPEINAELDIPLQPARPPGAFALGPWNENLVKAAERTPLGFRPGHAGCGRHARRSRAGSSATQRDHRNQTRRVRERRRTTIVEAEARRLIGARVAAGLCGALTHMRQLPHSGARPVPVARRRLAGGVRPGHRRHHRGQPPGGARRPVRRHSRHAHRRPPLHRRGGGARRRGRAGAARHASGPPACRRVR